MNAKSTSVRIGPKGLGYTISSTGRKRVTASIPGTGISYSEAIPTKRKAPEVRAASLPPPSKAKKNNLFPVALVLFAAVIGIGIASNNNSSTNPSSAIVSAPASATQSLIDPAAKPDSAPSVPAAAIETTPVPQTSATPAPEMRYVTASSLNVRSEPSTAGSIVGKLPTGHQVSILEKSNGWLLVQSATAGRGWVSEQYTSASRPDLVVSPPPQALLAAPSVNRDAIIQQIIERSIRNYSGNCPCPYSTMRNGRRCGGNSAYSKPGGRSPICFPSDVTEAMIAAFRR